MSLSLSLTHTLCNFNTSRYYFQTIVRHRVYTAMHRSVVVNVYRRVSSAYVRILTGKPASFDEQIVLLDDPDFSRSDYYILVL